MINIDTSNTVLSPNTEFLNTVINDGALTVTLNRPQQLNAFVPEMLEEIARLVNAASTDPSVAVIVLEGAGRAFSAGVDLKVLQGIEPAAGKIGDIFDQPARTAYEAIRSASCPVIAKVHGACFTGALEMALHCDFILTTVDTKFGDTHAKFGLRPTWGMSQTLAQAVGVRRAKELSFTARTFSGADALNYGIASEAVADKAALDQLVSDYARRIAANSSQAVAAIKDLYDLSQQRLGMQEALDAELSREYPLIEDTNQRLSDF